MTKFLYLEGGSGISGDMTVAALLDLGASEEKLNSALQSLPSDEFHYHIERKFSYSISGLDFDVHIHHHDKPREEHYHEHHHKSHNHHRHLKNIYEIIDFVKMPDKARKLAKKIFMIIAESEAKVHGCKIEEVHFHEVGAIDSIADIIAASVLIDDLGIENCIVSGLTEGQGIVMSQHGKLPVPVPAVLNIAEKYGITLRSSDIKGEMVTPTGIAIAAALKTHEKLPNEYKILKTGIGLGKRDFGTANFLRAMIIEEAADPERIFMIETNIDDSTPEELGIAMETILKAGALDVSFIPCFMKKNRPAVLLNILTTADKLTEIEELIFRNTSTIGLRKYPVERTVMKREIIKINLPKGDIEVKKSEYKNIIRFQPEYESVKKYAEKTDLTFRDVFNLAREKAEKEYGP